MKNIRTLLSFMRPFRRFLILSLLLTVSLTAVGMAPPILMRNLLNGVAKEGNWGLFPLLIGLLFAVPLLRGFINIANGISLNRISLGIIARTRKRIFDHLMRLSMRFFNEMPVGGISQRLMGDVATVSGTLTGGMISFLADIVSIGIALFMMFQLSWILTLVTLALLPIYYLNYRFFSRRIKEQTAILRSRMDHISSTLQERLSAHELIQSYAQEKAEAAYFSSQAKQIMSAAVQGSSYSISFNQLSEFVNKLGNTLIYCIGCLFFIRGTMGYGDVVAFAAYATQLLGPVVRFSAVANQIIQSGIAIERINEILHREPAIKEAEDAIPISSLRGTIRINGVTFDYGSGTPVLKDVDMEIPGGSDLAIVGSQGAGRSTLAMILRRFYDPEEGSVEVDGIDIRRYRLKDYRRAIALVQPEAVIFDGTIRENLTYGKPDAAEERMIEVSEAVGFHEFVSELKAGYDTRLGSGGLRLSAGDRQRIGIARALISEPLIIIIDEATAVLDPESAEKVNSAVQKAMENNTYIMIVHRTMMARTADRVVVMKDGQVVEEGAFQELIVNPESVCRELAVNQYGEENLPEPKGPDR